jgi:hypothetical protein
MNEELEQLLLNLKLITVAARLLARLPFGTQQLHEQRPYRRTVTLGGGEILLEPAALDARLKRAQLPDVWTLETFPFKVQTGGG